MKQVAINHYKINALGRFVLSVFVIAWLNLAAQPCLMAMEPAPEPAAAQAPSWIGQLMASEVLAQQKPLAGRAGLDEERAGRLEERRRQVRLARTRGEPHIGAVQPKDKSRIG